MLKLIRIESPNPEQLQSQKKGARTRKPPASQNTNSNGSRRRNKDIIEMHLGSGKKSSACRCIWRTLVFSAFSATRQTQITTEGVCQKCPAHRFPVMDENLLVVATHQIA